MVAAAENNQNGWVGRPIEDKEIAKTTGARTLTLCKKNSNPSSYHTHSSSPHRSTSQSSSITIALPTHPPNPPLCGRRGQHTRTTSFNSGQSTSLTCCSLVISTSLPCFTQDARYACQCSSKCSAFSHERRERTKRISANVAEPRVKVLSE